MPDDPREWTREFEALGTAKVRTALATSQWSGDKRAAARVWIENRDGQAWQASRREKPGDATSLATRLRSSKWAKYAIPAAMVIFSLGMILRRLKAF